MDEKLYMSATFWHQDIRVSHLQENTRNFIFDQVLAFNLTPPHKAFDPSAHQTTFKVDLRIQKVVFFKIPRKYLKVLKSTIKYQKVTQRTNKYEILPLSTIKYTKE